MRHSFHKNQRIKVYSFVFESFKLSDRIPVSRSFMVLNSKARDQPTEVSTMSIGRSPIHRILQVVFQNTLFSQPYYKPDCKGHRSRYSFCLVDVLRLTLICLFWNWIVFVLEVRTGEYVEKYISTFPIHLMSSQIWAVVGHRLCPSPRHVNK